jgi:hypothetical protein
MMTKPRILALALGAALLSGCGTSNFSEDVKAALGPREKPRSRVFQAEERPTFDAVKSAALEMGYRVVHGGPAEEELEALSPISTDEEPGSSRQISMKVTLSPAAESGTNVEVSLTEVIQEQSANTPGMATQSPLNDTPLYEVFFRNVQQALAQPHAHDH